MAVATTIAAAPLAGAGKSAPATLTLTPPCTGVEVQVTVTTAAGVTPTFGVILKAELSEDGITFGTPFRVCEAMPGETRVTFHEAKNCAKVRYTLVNTDQTQTQTASLITNQV